MLGRHADHFFAAQMHERVTAISPNGGGRSFSPPDQERAGAPHVSVKRGMQMLGPQRMVSGGSIPGMGSITPPRPPPAPTTGRGALPGMSGVFGVDRSGAMPGMGAYVSSPAYQGVGQLQPSGSLPGMGNLFGLLGDITISNTTLLTAGAAVAAWLYFKSKHGKKA